MEVALALCEWTLIFCGVAFILWGIFNDDHVSAGACILRILTGFALIMAGVYLDA